MCFIERLSSLRWLKCTSIIEKRPQSVCFIERLSSLWRLKCTSIIDLDFDLLLNFLLSFQQYLIDDTFTSATNTHNACGKNIPPHDIERMKKILL